MKIKILFFIFLVLILLAGASYFGARYYLISANPPEYFYVHPTIAKVFYITPNCPSTCAENGVCGEDDKDYCNKCIAFRSRAGYSHDGRCQNAYKNNTYGFEMSFPNSWKGFYVEKSIFKGWKVDGLGEIKDMGTELIFRNPQTTDNKKYQDIPIMVFTPDLWELVQKEKIAVSAAPIGPEKIGENSKYIFATPPRWYGFTDEQGWQEAVDIVKTFKAF